MVGNSLRGVRSLKTRIQTNFKRLSKRSKMLVVSYLAIISLLFGGIGRSAYINYKSPEVPINHRRPIEITYSSFMDLVETQAKQSTPALPLPSSSAATFPKMDKVKVAPDRIHFRLSKPHPTENGKVQYLSVYTRKPPATSETIDYLRKYKLDFSAASNSKSTMAVYALRSAMFTLYALFLWRMYQTMKGASGGGNSNQDVPGKVLSRNTDQDGRPLASFTDIQGIDDAKTEVMELVDTLRNPEKYAILGARAPTGLLLEGPPGTGKVCFFFLFVYFFVACIYAYCTLFISHHSIHTIPQHSKTIMHFIVFGVDHAGTSDSRYGGSATPLLLWQ